jgi:hypothetical protein
VYIQHIIEYIVVYIQHIIEYIVVYIQYIIEYIVVFWLNDISVSTATQRGGYYQTFTCTAVWPWMMRTTLIISSA